MTRFIIYINNTFKEKVTLQNWKVIATILYTKPSAVSDLKLGLGVSAISQSPVQITDLRRGDNFWRDVPLASVSDRILPVIYRHEFVPVMTKEQPTYRQVAVDNNFLEKPFIEKPKFPCPTCPSVFSHKNNLYYHSKFECGQSPRFNCPYCAYRTKHVSNVRAHVRRKHPGNKVYAIDVCKDL